MKKLLIFASVIMLVACSTEYEQPNEEVRSVTKNSFKVSEEEAIERLEKMLNVYDPATRGKKRTIKEIIPRIKPQTRAYAAEIPDTMYYYVNFDDNEGYAIVAADERAIPILALIDTGNYVLPQAYIDRTNAIVDSLDLIYPPEDDDFWCFGYNGSFSTEEMIEDLCDGYISDLSPYSKVISYQDTVRQVGPLLKTKWDQGFPYNARCQNFHYFIGYIDPYAPTDLSGYYISNNSNFDICVASSYTSAAGCVALALAQICAYHQHPSYSPYDNHQYDWGSITNTQTLAEGQSSRYFSNVYYLSPDWYSSTKNKVSEISHLIKTVGIASKTIYGEKSASRIKWAKSALNDILDYTAEEEDGFNRDNICNELNNHRPVYQRGRTRNLMHGHAWVIDGYRQFNVIDYKVFYKDNTYIEELGRQIVEEYDTYYYHCNFGWEGRANGYYLGELFTTTQGPVMPSDGESSGTTHKRDYVKRFKSLYITPNK